MVKSCAIYGCISSSSNDKDRHFYKFPCDENRRKRWIQASGRPELVNKSAETLQNAYSVCDLHFQNSDRQAKKLKNYAIPTLNLGLRELSNPSKLTQTENDTEYFISQKDATSQINTLLVPSTSHATQTTQELSARKRKLQTELRAEFKRRKSLENQKTFVDQEKFTLRLSNIIDLQYRLQQNSPSNRYENEYKLLALNIYFASPLAYRVLAKTLSLPSKRTLRRININTSGKLNPNVYDCLKTKLKSFNDSEKYCIICADEISLKRNLHYQINKDKIIGFHEIDGVQTTELASRGFVIMARGIFTDWKQQLGYSLLAQSKNDKEVNEWVDHVISQLINIGFEVVAFVTNQGSNFLKLATQRGVSSDKPYFCINGRKIYHIFDVPHLIKSVRNSLIKHDFEFVDSDGTTVTAKWENVQKFYRQDIKRSCRLAPKLTESHVNPNNFEKIKVRTAAQVFSSTVAAAINASIECGKLEKSALGTVKFIELMDKTFDILNSSVLNDSNNYKNAFAFKPYQTEVLDRFDYFLSTVTVLNKTKNNVSNSIKCLKGLRISIQSIKNLARDLKSDDFRSLYTRRLNQDPLVNFFDSVRKQDGGCLKPTPVQFTSAFRKLFMGNVLKHSKNANCSDDLDQLLLNADDISHISKIQSANEHLKPENPTVESLAVAVGTVDYRFDLPQNNAFLYVCGYLLKKCADIHKCEEIDLFLQQSYPEVKEKSFLSFEVYDENEILPITPPGSFVIFVKEMDDCFIDYFQQNILDRVGSQILKELNEFSFTECCECFPNEYLRKLFVRFRIFNIIKINNRCFRDKSYKRENFSVCNI